MHAKRTFLWTTGALVLGGMSLLSGAAASRTGRVEIRIPAGTQFIGALQQTVSTKLNEEGDRVTIKTEEPLQIGEEILPGGMVLSGEITRAKGGGRLSGAPSLRIRFNRLEVGGRDYAITTVQFRVKGKNSTSETAKQVGIGAVVGGVVGAVAGSTVKGAAIGAILGTGVAVATDGKDIELPAGTRLRVELAEPVTVQY